MGTRSSLVEARMKDKTKCHKHLIFVLNKYRRATHAPPSRRHRAAIAPGLALALAPFLGPVSEVGRPWSAPHTGQPTFRYPGSLPAHGVRPAADPPQLRRSVPRAACRCDLVPTWATARWVQLLSAEYPTLAFHSSLTNSFGAQGSPRYRPRPWHGYPHQLSAPLARLLTRTLGYDRQARFAVRALQARARSSSCCGSSRGSTPTRSRSPSASSVTCPRRAAPRQPPETALLSDALRRCICIACAVRPPGVCRAAPDAGGQDVAHYNGTLAGYPNVGKSSVINTLRAKKVPLPLTIAHYTGLCGSLRYSTVLCGTLRAKKVL